MKKLSNKKLVSMAVSIVVVIIYLALDANSGIYDMAVVTKNVDGDTIYVSLAGISEDKKVRFIGVDTPESTMKIEEYGKEASKFTEETLYEGRIIYLEKDVSETDKYGRLLRYIWLEKPGEEITYEDIETKMFNSVLVSEGYANVATYPPDVKYTDIFLELEREARENDRGLWKLEDNKE